MAKKKGRSGAVIAGLAFGLAGGVALGTYVLAPNLAGGSNATQTSLESQLADARQQVEIADAQSKSADGFIDSVSGAALTDKLKDRPVLIMRTADANDDDVQGVKDDLSKSGAVDSGTITLTDKFFSQEGADGLKNIVSTTLPAGAQLNTDQLDSGTHAGEALGSALMLNKDSAQPQATTEERAIVLGGLSEGGFIQYDEGTILPAQVIVFVLGDDDGSSDTFTTTNEVAFARALDTRGSGVVVAGRIHTASDTGVIGQLRDNALALEAVSTVDSVDQAWGKIATVLAAKDQLDGKAGAYGAAASAKAAAPSI
ncbi:copper transporter [Corynebacterium vitaeruminis]|uniref:copper transporter n=1 Tax=Corynebacterium vitaeruminis TaxID=38305 RepID=UPI0023F573D4|nr:copper transporter [Corynebacterium vitaeruminis]